MPTNNDFKDWAAKILMHKMLGIPIPSELQEKKRRYAKDIEHYENEDYVKDSAIEMADDYIGKVLERNRPSLQTNLNRWKQKNPYGLLARNGISTANLRPETRNSLGRARQQTEINTELKRVRDGIIARQGDLRRAQRTKENLETHRGDREISTSERAELIRKNQLEIAQRRTELQGAVADAQDTLNNVKPAIKEELRSNPTSEIGQENQTLVDKINGLLAIIRYYLQRLFTGPKMHNDFCPQPANPVTRLATRHQAFKR